MSNNSNNTQMPDINSITTSMRDLQVNPHNPVYDLTNQPLSTTLASSTHHNPPPQPLSIRARALEPKSEDVILQYGHYLTFTGEALADSDLPSSPCKLETLGNYISNELMRRYQAGEVVNVVFSPLAHPCHPCWILVHEVNDVIMKVYGEMEGLERAMGRMGVS
jgi:hypothetical protein